jgi:cathepsin B
MVRQDKSPRNTDSESPERSAAAERARMASLKKKEAPGLWKLHGYKISIGVIVLLSAWMLFSALVGKESVVITKTKVNDEAYLESLKARKFATGRVEFFGDMMLSDAKPLFNNVVYPQNKQLYMCQPSEAGDMLEDSFDFRKEYPECAQPVADQGNCSSGYAVAVANVISDRMCQASKRSRPLSAMPMIACDRKKINTQCKGGYVTRALDYSKTYGLYEEDCFPYDISKTNETCEEVLKACPKEKVHKVEEYCVVREVENIKKEIKSKGPVIATIPIYRDFLVYKGGAFKVTPGTPRYQGEHVVKVIGWTTIEDTPVWIIENSLGTSWGDQGIGYIAIGQDEFYF